LPGIYFQQFSLAPGIYLSMCVLIDCNGLMVDMHILDGNCFNKSIASAVSWDEIIWTLFKVDMLVLLGLLLVTSMAESCVTRKFKN